MKEEKQTRKNTRTQVWPDTRAILRIVDPLAPRRKVKTIKGRVGDLGATGMFFITKEFVPVPAKAEIVIDFDAKRPATLTLEAAGETVRRAADGVGIKFTSIDMQRLQDCIMTRMNRS